MKNKIFYSAPLALLCLLSAFNTEPGTGTASVASSTQAGVSLTAAEDGFTCTLPAPASFDGERTSATTTALAWSTVPNAAAYRLKVYNLSTNELVFDDTEYGTAKSLINLASGVAYRCVLASVCLNGTTSDFVIIVDIL